MRVLVKLFFVILAMLSFSMPVRAMVTFNVVVLPADLFKVCANYYCYPEVSEIIASDVIDNFHKTDRIFSPSISYVRKAMSETPELKRYTNSVLTRYSKDKSLDFTAMKYIAKSFKANSILIISNDVPVKDAYVRRGVWEMLVLSTNFNINYKYEMETNAVLVDTVNDLVMWSGSYKKQISDNNNTFKAPNASDAYAKLEYFRLYSQDILSKQISQNVYLRFFPKVVDPQPIVENSKPEGAYFRFESDSNVPALQTQLIQQQRERYREFNEDEPDTSYGEMIYGF